MKFVGSCLVLAISLLGVERIALAQSATSQDVRHGIAQLQQLLEDRPDMQVVFPAGSPVNVWIEDAFANTEGRRVYWDNRQPVSGRNGEHTAPFNGYPTSIRITDKPEVSPLDKYATVIFELQSAKRTGEKLELYRSASKGELNAQEFAERIVIGDFHAMVDTQVFFKANRFAKLASEGDVYTLAILTMHNDLKDYLKQLKDTPPGPGNALDYYKSSYESIAKEQNASR